MKCPKCGYNSFEVHNSCKKCAHDLTSYKDIHGIKSIVLPHESRTIMAEKLMADKLHDAPAAPADVPADMFSFEIPEDDAPEASSYIKDDPFDFGDEAASPASFPFGDAQMSAQAKAEEDAFSDLLESSSQNTREAPSAPQSAGTDYEFGSGTNSFSWDDTPDIAPAEAAKPAKGDFDSLFGDTDDSAKK
jgi:hypothetical protein